MSLSDGQPVNAAVTNAAFISKTTADSKSGEMTFNDKVNLEDAGSATVTDAQLVINDLIQEFNATTGHNHDGVNSKKITMTNIDTTGGTAGQVYKADGAGNGSWEDDNSGGGGGGGITAITVATNTTLLTTGNEVVFVDTTAGDVTLTLPPSEDTVVYRIAKITGDLNKVIISPDGAETIDGVTSWELYDRYTSFQIAGDGSNWFSIKEPTARTAYYKDVKAAGTPGGTFTAGGWQTRTLNTVEGNNFGALSTDQVSLPPGLYIIDAMAMGYRVSNHKTRIQNITDATTVAQGLSVYSADSGDNCNTAPVSAVFTVTGGSNKLIELHHQCSATRTTNGFGTFDSIGTNEVYSVMKIKKVL